LLPALPAVFVVRSITIRCFRMSAPKAENGFVGQENCFVGRGPTKQSFEKFNDFSQIQVVPQTVSRQRRHR
jgi:hypothetical protein